MYDYYYPNVHRGLNNPEKLDESGGQILLFDEVVAIFPNVVSIIDEGTYLRAVVSEELGTLEVIDLGDVIFTHKDYVGTPIESVHRHWKSFYSDYKTARSAIAHLVIVEGWDNLSNFEKKIAAQWFVVGAPQRVEMYSLEEQVTFGKLYHVNSVEARKKRLVHAVGEIFGRLQKSEVNELISDCSILTYDYINFGKEGTAEGDSQAFFDYMLGRSGTIYAESGSGFANKGFEPSGITMEELTELVMQTLKSGVYE